MGKTLTETIKLAAVPNTAKNPLAAIKKARSKTGPANAMGIPFGMFGLLSKKDKKIVTGEVFLGKDDPVLIDDTVTKKSVEGLWKARFKKVRGKTTRYAADNDMIALSAGGLYVSLPGMKSALIVTTLIGPTDINAIKVVARTHSASDQFKKMMVVKWSVLKSLLSADNDSEQEANLAGLGEEERAQALDLAERLGRLKITLSTEEASIAAMSAALSAAPTQAAIVDDQLDPGMTDAMNMLSAEAAAFSVRRARDRLQGALNAGQAEIKGQIQTWESADTHATLRASLSSILGEHWNHVGTVVTSALTMLDRELDDNNWDPARTALKQLQTAIDSDLALGALFRIGVIDFNANQTMTRLQGQCAFLKEAN